MRRSTSFIALASSLVLAACTGRASSPEVRIETVPVAVPAPCVVSRPYKPVPLKDRIAATEWAKRPAGAKAQALVAQGGTRLNYTDALAASTSGCAEVASGH